MISPSRLDPDDKGDRLRPGRLGKGAIK